MDDAMLPDPRYWEGQCWGNGRIIRVGPEMVSVPNPHLAGYLQVLVIAIVSIHDGVVSIGLNLSSTT